VTLGRKVAFIIALHESVAPAALAHAADSPPPDEGRDATRAVFVHLDSPDPVDLQRETGLRYEPFSTVCTSPCDTLVPADGKYRISSDSARPSHFFTFSAGAQRDDIRVRPASRGGFTGGIVLLSTGAAAFGLGAFWLLAQGLGESNGSQDGGDGRPIALGVLLGGLAALATGTVLTALNAKTKVSHMEGRWTAPPPVKPSEDSERTVRLRVRHDDAMEKALPAAAAIPLVAVRF
jgi:hypothetical protein